MNTDKNNTQLPQSSVSVSVTDLRIGNYLLKSLKSGNGRKVNDKIGVEDIVRIYENTGSFNYEQILLNEEWLLKFGFYEMGNEYSLSDGFFYTCFKFFKNGNKKIWINSESTKYIKGDEMIINTVHQLQNLYHALTGSELQISSITER